MAQSPTIGALAAALAKAHASFKPAVKDANNPFFKSKYVDLAGAYDACAEALSSNGLAVVQTTATASDKVVLVSTLIHASGEWISGEYPVNPVKSDPQGYGSAMTYARRYALMALVGLAAEDDDGEAASGRAQKVASTTGEVMKKKPTWTPQQSDQVATIFTEINKLGGDLGYKEIQDLRKKMKYDDPDDVIACACTLLDRWRDIADQATQQEGNG